MATYDYRCSACGHEATLTRSMQDPIPQQVECPVCVEEINDPEGGAWCFVCVERGLRRVYTQAGINFGYRPHLHDQNEQFKFKNL